MPTPLKARILLADDHALVREGLRLILERQPDLEVAAEASDGAEAIDRALHTELDLAVLDVSMPRLTGLQAARHLRAQRPELKVLMLSMHDNEQFFFEALKVGAAGYVLKTAADEDLVSACRAALRGESFLYAGAVRALIRDFLDRGKRGEELPEDPLTPRELEVVKLIAEGHTTKEIAQVLVISENTVERHRSNVLDKLGLRDRVALALYAVRRGLIEP
jgi:DNA-binding NarL/FixJ family response regulator